MGQIEFFKKLRDTSDQIVKALESEDAEKLETAMGKFVLLMIQADAMK